jgi:ubiquinone/menaquinone biosynthesis C-methylase UbiE
MAVIDAPAAYGRIAPVYERLHGRFLRLAGGEAQCAFEGAVTALLAPGMAVLDAGCGTGTLARRLLAHRFGAFDLTLLDCCPQMLARAASTGARVTTGAIEDMPFEDQSFDLVTCAWTLETLQRPERGLTELLRVTRPGGHLCLVFCAQVERPGLGGRIMRAAVRRRRTGRFLDEQEIAGIVSAHAGTDVRRLPCTGPAAAMVVRKAAA